MPERVPMSSINTADRFPFARHAAKHDEEGRGKFATFANSARLEVIWGFLRGKSGAAAPAKWSQKAPRWTGQGAAR